MKLGTGLSGGQEEEPEQRHGDHLDHQQEQQVRGCLRQKDHAAVHGHEQDALHAALLLLVVERAVQAQQRREHDERPQKAAGKLQHVGRLRRLPERRAVHDEHEQRVDAHGREHLLGAELLLQVLALAGSYTGRTCWARSTPPGRLAPDRRPFFACAPFTTPPFPPWSGTARENSSKSKLVLSDRTSPRDRVRQHQRMRAHVEALAQVMAHHDEGSVLRAGLRSAGRRCPRHAGPGPNTARPRTPRRGRGRGRARWTGRCVMPRENVRTTSKPAMLQLDRLEQLASRAPAGLPNRRASHTKAGSASAVRSG